MNVLGLLTKSSWHKTPPLDASNSAPDSREVRDVTRKGVQIWRRFLGLSWDRAWSSTNEPLDGRAGMGCDEEGDATPPVGVMARRCGRCPTGES